MHRNTLKTTQLVVGTACNERLASKLCIYICKFINVSKHLVVMCARGKHIVMM